MDEDKKYIKGNKFICIVYAKTEKEAIKLAKDQKPNIVVLE